MESGEATACHRRHMQQRLCRMTLIMSLGCDTGLTSCLPRPLSEKLPLISWEMPWVKGTFQSGTSGCLINFWLLSNDGAHQRGCSCAGQPVHHPICNLNSLTGRESQAVHLRLQKVRLKYKEYPMPGALHKFCFDSDWGRDGERRGQKVMGGGG